MTSSDQQKTIRRGVISGLLAVMCWAGFVLVSRLGGQGVMLPWDVVVLRFVIGSVILLAMAWRQLLWNVRGLVLAMVGGLGYSLMVYQGFRMTSAVHAAVMLPGAIPLAAAIFSKLILGERFSLVRTTGLALICVGIASMLISSDVKVSLAGDAWLLGAVLAWALYTVLARRWRVSPMAGAVTTAAGSAALFLPVYLLWLPGQLMQAPWQELLIQGVYQGVIASVVAMLLYLRAVVSIGPAATGALMALVPVLSGLAAVPVLGETLELLELMGLLVTSLGAVMASGLLQSSRQVSLEGR